MISFLVLFIILFYRFNTFCVSFLLSTNFCMICIISIIYHLLGKLFSYVTVTIT